MTPEDKAEIARRAEAYRSKGRASQQAAEVDAWLDRAGRRPRPRPLSSLSLEELVRLGPNLLGGAQDDDDGDDSGSAGPPPGPKP